MPDPVILDPQPITNRGCYPRDTYMWRGRVFLLAVDMVVYLHGVMDMCPTPSCHANDPGCRWRLREVDGTWQWVWQDKEKSEGE